jgi:hypothetical protein
MCVPIGLTGVSIGAMKNVPKQKMVAVSENRSAVAFCRFVG